MRIFAITARTGGVIIRKKEALTCFFNPRVLGKRKIRSVRTCFDYIGELKEDEAI